MNEIKKFICDYCGRQEKCKKNQKIPKGWDDSDYLVCSPKCAFAMYLIRYVIEGAIERGKSLKFCRDLIKLIGNPANKEGTSRTPL